MEDDEVLSVEVLPFLCEKGTTTIEDTSSLRENEADLAVA
jgi:hypothetical protein